MKKDVDLGELGWLHINQNIWTGKFSFDLNGTPFKKVSKESYVIDFDDKTIKLYLSGNSFKGRYITIDSKIIEISKPIPWYTYILIAIPIILSIILGSISGLKNNGFYILHIGGNYTSVLMAGVIGGISGAIYFGLGAITAYITTLPIKKLYIKLLLALVVTIITIGVLIGFGYLFKGYFK